MRKLFILFILAGISFQASSQNTGYLGKHVMLKTDLINEKRSGFQNLDLEVVAGRKTSFAASFRNFEYAGTKGTKETKKEQTVEFTVYHPGYYSPELIWSAEDFYEYTSVTPGKTKGWLATIGIKQFFNHIVPAPIGFYTSMEIGYGKATLLYDYGTRYEKMYKSLDHGIVDPLPTTTISSNCEIFYFSLPSLGYQTVFLNRLVVDAEFQLEGWVNNLPEELTNKYKYPYFSTNIGSVNKGNTTFGPAIYGKVGFLLF
jgi:hypothetical protein